MEPVQDAGAAWGRPRGVVLAGVLGVPGQDIRVRDRPE
jgi:hypothetical protein